MGSVATAEEALMQWGGVSTTVTTLPRRFAIGEPSEEGDTPPGYRFAYLFGCGAFPLRG